MPTTDCREVVVDVVACTTVLVQRSERRRQPKKRGLKFEIDNGLWAIVVVRIDRARVIISVHFHFKRHVHMTYMYMYIY